MTRLRTVAALAAALLAVALTGGTACAQDGAKVLAERQDLMKQQGKDMKAVKDYIDGKGELGPAQSAAADLTQTMAKIPAEFPKDTGMEQFPKSGAKPAIWTEWDKFLAAQKTAAAKAEALNAAFKGGDKAAITAAFGDLGKNGCGGCHEPFREKKT
jgi:cytochrome c556